MSSAKYALFFTCCNEPYYHFAAIYPLFVLENVPEGMVEIGVTDLSSFTKSYKPIMDFYGKHYPGRVKYRECPAVEGHTLNAIRFLYQPLTKAEYVYIGDIDILILADNIVSSHVKNMELYHLDYSNIVRHNKTSNRLTGLHFCRYDMMYPIHRLNDVPVNINDEEYLYLLMADKGLKTPPKEAFYRPIHGIHCSYNRPVFDKTPMSGIDNGAVRWGIGAWTDKFIAFTKKDVYRAFIGLLQPRQHLALLRLLETVELACFYYNRTHPFRHVDRMRRKLKRYLRHNRHHLSI